MEQADSQQAGSIAEEEFFSKLKEAFLRVYRGENRVDLETEKSAIVAYWVGSVLRVDVKPKKKLPIYPDSPEGLPDSF